MDKEQALELDKITSTSTDELAEALNIQKETAELIKCLIDKYLNKGPIRLIAKK